MSENHDACSPRDQEGTSGDAQSKSESDKEENGNRTAKRVNITISEGQHDDLTEFADENGMHFSELVRRSCARFRNQHENDQTSRELQPLLYEIRKQSGQLESQSALIEALGTRLDELNQPSEDDSDRTDLSDKELANELWEFLGEDGPMTIPELVRDAEFDRRQVQRGMNKLRDAHVVMKVENESGETAWVTTA